MTEVCDQGRRRRFAFDPNPAKRKSMRREVPIQPLDVLAADDPLYSEIFGPGLARNGKRGVDIVRTEWRPPDQVKSGNGSKLAR
jgi:hypothetical protein